MKWWRAVGEIAVSGLPLDYPHSGTAVYLRNLLPLLPSVAPDLRFRVYVRNATAWELPSTRLTTPVAGFNRGSGAGAQVDKLLWEIGSLPAAAALHGASLIHSPTFAAPVLSPCPVVVTVHDLIPLILQDYHRSPRAVYYSRLMAWTVSRATAIITVSEHAKRDVMRVLGVGDDRVTVTYEAADARFSPRGSPNERERLGERYALPQRYVLYLGGAERRKNLETLVRAWAARRDALRRCDVRLVLVAHLPPPDNLYPDIRRLVRELDLGDDVHVVDRVDEEDKPAVYRNALLFVFPSRYEGFGLTPLEAMASGVPVLCSNATSLPEVTGDAARQLSPDDPAAWGDAMVELLRDDVERDRLREAGLRRAASFSWERTARQTVDVYRSVLAR
jgi:glycosyltransferase involved in cell wall biosynthesis